MEHKEITHTLNGILVLDDEERNGRRHMDTLIGHPGGDKGTG